LNIFKNVIDSCDGKAEFSASLLQSSVSHDSSEIILICRFGAQKTIFLTSTLKTVAVLDVFVETITTRCRHEM